MCTVTYLPFQSGYVLTHNRDEAPLRSPTQISRVPGKPGTMLFPRDTKAGGAWVVVEQHGHTACLLNGAFLKHQHSPPYRRSRGLILLDFMEWPDREDFFTRYVLEEIEPFTLLSFHAKAVTEFRWDGNKRYRKELSPTETHFWCSATLYPPDMQIRREKIFRDWLENQKIAQADFLQDAQLPAQILRLHLTGSVGDPANDYVMNRNNRVCTVSVTQVICQENAIEMRYTDLLQDQEDAQHLQPA